VNRDNDGQIASMNKIQTMSSYCKNGTNKKRILLSELHLWNWRQAYAD